jgi:drug/metabolite transporter (DMT)-like permease
LQAYLGEIAALTTAVCWAFTSLLFTIASKQVGSQLVNRVRLPLAALFLAVTHLLWQGQVLPIHAETSRWGWLGLSAISGLVRNSNSVDSNPRNYVIGVLCGIGGASGQALGLILSKRGMGGDFPALSASLMRLTTASVVIWLWALIQGQLRPTVEGLRHRRARLAILGGTLAGPFMGMTLSLAAVQFTHVGIASTLMALSPVILLPPAHWIFKERITQRAIVGTVVALVGVAMIFWM